MRYELSLRNTMSAGQIDGIDLNDHIKTATLYEKKY